VREQSFGQMVLVLLPKQKDEKSQGCSNLKFFDFNGLEAGTLQRRS
jgi:hypothetical protein